MTALIFILIVAGFSAIGYYMADGGGRFMEKNGRIGIDPASAAFPSCVQVTSDTKTSEITAAINRFRKAHASCAVFLCASPETADPLPQKGHSS